MCITVEYGYFAKTWVYNVGENVSRGLLEKLGQKGDLCKSEIRVKHLLNCNHIEDFESHTHFEKEYTIKKNSINYKYKLDSIIITNKDHFNPKENSHFLQAGGMYKALCLCGSAQRAEQPCEEAILLINEAKGAYSIAPFSVMGGSLVTFSKK